MPVLDLPDGAPAPKPAPPAPELPKQPWFTKIDRKVWAGGVGGLLSWALLAGCSAWLGIDLAAYLQPYVTIVASIFGIVPAPSAQGGLAILFGFGIAYLVPAAYADIYKRINNRIVAQAVVDPASPVTVKKIEAAVQVAKVEAIVAGTK